MQTGKAHKPLGEPLRQKKSEDNIMSKSACVYECVCVWEDGCLMSACTDIMCAPVQSHMHAYACESVCMCLSPTRHRTEVRLASLQCKH